MPKTITIYDIAFKANVSPSAVSKALNGRKDVNPETRRMILDIAATMGYQPNFHARSLKMKKSWIVGVVYEDLGCVEALEHPLFLPILNAFKRSIELHGYEILFLSHSSLFEGGNLLAHAFSRQVDGLLLMGFPKNEIPAILSASKGIPMVACDSLVPTIASVATDNVVAAKDAVEYLASLGHTRIAHIAGPSDNVATAGDERLAGYREGLRLCGIPYDPDLVVRAEGWSPYDGGVAFEQLLKTAGNGFTAVFAAADFYIMGMRQACGKHGMRIPEDVSVVGFDDAQWTEYVEPGYTTFRQDKERLGGISAQLLIDCMDGLERKELVRVPAQLVKRGSCAEMRKRG
ncbi:MAG: LacI family DNA-binding transcriptional regulator [Sphaerochaetaceae bacterium]